MIGKTLGNYEILKPLGAGGMGEVYRAHDTNLKRDVAIKVLPEALAVDTERLARLQREARLLASVNHPNIAAIYNLEQAEGVCWLVLELVEGTTLEQRLRQGPLPVPESLRVAGQVAAALEAAHEEGIVHRDLKSANVMLDKKGRVKVLDFGIAKDLSVGGLGQPVDRGGALSAETSLATGASDLAAHLTATGMIVGTVPYMGPEQVRGQPIDERTDNWAFGCLLFELLTGRRPFDRETMADTLSAVLEHEPDWTLLPSGTPDAVQALIRRCLQKDAENRLQAIGDARVELHEVEATGTGVPVTTGSRVAAPATFLRSPKLKIAMTVAVMLATVAFVSWGSWPSMGTVVEPSDAVGSDIGAVTVAYDAPAANAVAVLPFAGIGAEPDDTFPEQLASEVLFSLSKVSGLQVPGQRSSFAFQEMDEPVETSEIGRRLRVASLLEGTVTRSGDRIVVHVYLVTAVDGYERWSQRYERPYDADALFEIQEDIAREVARALEVELAPSDSQQLAARPTENTEAYEAYMVGQLTWPRRTKESLNEAVHHFRTAIRLDPDFALAYVGLANSYLMLRQYTEMSPEVADTEASAAVEAALALDPELAEALVPKALLMSGGDREATLRRAIELNPNDSWAHHTLANQIYYRDGPTEEASALMHLARDLDPLDPGPSENLVYLYLDEGRFEDAIDQARWVTNLDPQYPLGYLALGLSLHYSGRADLAIAALDRGLAMSPEDSGRYTRNLGLAQASVGETEAALDTLSSRVASGGVRHDYMLVGDAYRDIAGSLDDAAEWYRRAAEADARPVPDVSLLLSAVELDRGDEAAAERLVERSEETNPNHRYTRIARLNLDMHRAEYASNAPLVADLAARDFRINYFYDQMYLHGRLHPIEPLGYFGVLAGRPQDSRLFFETNFSELLEDDPPVNAFTLKAAIDLAAVLLRTGEEEHAKLLLRKSEAYVDRLPGMQRRHQFRTAPMHIYALQGRTEDALDAMQLAIDDGFASGWWRLDKKPHFESVREEPRFQEMMRQLREKATG